MDSLTDMASKRKAMRFELDALSESLSTRHLLVPARDQDTQCARNVPRDPTRRHGADGVAARCGHHRRRRAVCPQHGDRRDRLQPRPTLRACRRWTRANPLHVQVCLRRMSRLHGHPHVRRAVARQVDHRLHLSLTRKS